MTACTKLSDRMPEVAAGTATWRTAEAEHLLGCAGCAAEWRVVAAAAGHGRRLAAGVDADRIAAAALARLREAPRAQAEPATRWGRIRRIALPLAAAATLALAVWLGGPSSESPAAPAIQVAVLPELDDLEETELESLFEEFADLEDPTIRPLEAPQTLDDLSDTELENLLRMMEG